MRFENSRLTADLIVQGGRVHTLDEDSTTVEALAIADGRIVALGSSHELSGLIGSRTTVVNLHGRSVIPGLIDNHTHQLMAGLDTCEAGVKANVSTCTSIEEIKQVVSQAARDAKPGEWITTSCLYRGAINDGRFPNRHDLDGAAPNNPVYIADGGRNILVNTRALELAGITWRTPDPSNGDREVADGHIVRDEDGIPTGHLIVGAGDLARRRWWVRLGQPIKMWDFLDFDQDTNVRALQAQMRIFNAAGITGTRDMGVSAREIEAYMELARRNEVTVRTDLIIGVPVQHLPTREILAVLDSYIGPKQGFGDEWLRIGGLKIVAQNYGYWSMQPEKLRTVILEGHRRGWSFAIHGTPGDIGNDIEVILSAMEEANREFPLAGRLWSYEHAFGLIDPDHMRRLSAFGVTIAANPALSYFGAGRAIKMHETMQSLRLVKDAVGLTSLERTVREWGQPVRSWLGAGLLVTGGTDCPAVSYDPEQPLLGLWSTFSQETLAGTLMPGETIDRETALRIWTINNAAAMGQQHLKGTLEPGKLADLVILSADPLEVPDEDFLSITVHETIVGGRTVYAR
jgi:predicted amidohydrolase YtcJ